MVGVLVAEASVTVIHSVVFDISDRVMPAGFKTANRRQTNLMFGTVFTEQPLFRCDYLILLGLSRFRVTTVIGVALSANLRVFHDAISRNAPELFD